ncbi:MAG TPA: GNAT family N-acetyltransferase [Methylobacterium sp.]
MPASARPTRPGAARATVETAAALAADPAAWDDLLTRASAPHPHYGRQVVEAHRAHGLAPDDLACIVVRREGRLDAVLPFHIARDVSGLGLPVAQPFRSPFVTGTAPLVADGPDLADTLAALVAGLREASGGRAWRWPLLAIDSAVGRSLLSAMRDAGWDWGIVEAFERPVLDRRANHDAFLDGHPHRGRLKDLRRRQRRLAETGPVRLDTVTGGPELAEAVEAFLVLEQSGWKGAAGTALACRPQTAAFARALFAGGTGPVRTRADILRTGERACAISLALVAGGTACLLKTAYDEAERANAPGLVLEAEIVRALHETAFADRLDSATLGGSALESLYRDRETVAEIVALPERSALSLERRLRLARFEHAARAEAKRVLRRR